LAGHPHKIVGHRQLWEYECRAHLNLEGLERILV
jgi:hypothetical protein